MTVEKKNARYLLRASWPIGIRDDNIVYSPQVHEVAVWIGMALSIYVMPRAQRGEPRLSRRMALQSARICAKGGARLSL